MTENATKQSSKSTKSPKPPKVNVLDDQSSEEETPNAVFTAALEFARQATSVQTTLPSEPLLPESQITRKPGNLKPDRSGPGYSKSTHRICDDAIAALEDMKLLLKRTYGFEKIRYEEIVEEALLGIKRDLDEQRDQSILVQRLRGQMLPEKL